MSKIKLRSILILSCLGVAFCAFVLPTFFGGGKDTKEKPKTIEVVKVSLGSITLTGRMLGTIQAKKRTTLKAKKDGTLYMMYAQEGESVKKGAVLGSLRNGDLSRKYELALSAEGLAQKHYDRMRTLYEAGNISERAVEERKKDLLQAQVALEDSKGALRKSEFRASFDGICGVFKVAEGAYVKEGDEIVTVYDPKDCVVEFEAPESILSQLSVGQKVHVGAVEGSIASFQMVLDTKTHMGAGKANLVSFPSIMGAATTMEVELQTKHDVLVLPKEAVFLNNGTSHVYSVREEKAVLLPVKLGLQTQDSVEVIEGLSEGEQVILRGQRSLHDTQPVKIYTSEV
ncbi:MAG: efflux RND transporter periplasmic adaptor subunit [Alphaproteobacteria bacterium]|jgi:membrane fusion protein, multidrug efflux system|nr:efflux RND transporter periplasmic adaptor subunit [Alphaproteobacteria bacterium]MBT5390561.1 efflux RND transporter periplasmic adaptor subunit [Alphaproteobacteria bacterium]MBT5540920.1 efflux RND transporter periplasmic adaptor subunit [Alphaproteobacteria bacterium]